MLSRNYEFYLVITSYWPYGLPYNLFLKYEKARPEPYSYLNSYSYLTLVNTCMID